MNNTALRNYVIVNTVNTPLSRDYDYGIHAEGCADLKRGQPAMCQQYKATAATAQDVVKSEVDALAGDFGQESAEMFAFRVFPCCDKH